VGRDEQILDAAAELFHERGFHGASVDELGRRAGLSGPALYRHFAGKDAVLAALFNQALDELLTAAAASGSDRGAPNAALERLVRHHVAFTLAHRHLVNVYQREARSLVDPWREPFRHRTDDYGRHWENLLHRCYPDADPSRIVVAAQAALGMIYSITLWPRRALVVDGVEDDVVALVVASLTVLDQSG
jgi:AcrR family transcriptional regulator